MVAVPAVALPAVAVAVAVTGSPTLEDAGAVDGVLGVPAVESEEPDVAAQAAKTKLRPTVKTVTTARLGRRGDAGLGPTVPGTRQRLQNDGDVAVSGGTHHRREAVALEQRQR